jgi:hypothetical protein
MSNKKTEFDNKGIPSNLISDNGDNYQTKDVFRGDHKNLVEKNLHRLRYKNIKIDKPDDKEV